MIEAENLKLENEGMSEYQFTIILHPDTEEGGYAVTVPALPACVTQGETLEEAKPLQWLRMQFACMLRLL